jgi:CheY-specific phosphatase CheX
MRAVSLEALSPEKLFLGAGHLSCVVALKGVWRGHVEVRMANGLAYKAAAAMMMQALDTVGETDVLDATKEIANMLRAAIKSSLPRPCSMTVPESAVEQEEFCGSAGAEDSLVVAFHHSAGDLMVRIWEQECTQEQGWWRTNRPNELQRSSDAAKS